MSQKLSSNPERLEAVRLMLEGITKHKDELIAAGISDEFFQKMTEQKLLVEKTEADQERLKSEKKLCTELLNQEMKQLMKFYKRVRRIIKNDVPQAGWLEYGITAKR